MTLNEQFEQKIKHDLVNAKLSPAFDEMRKFADFVTTKYSLERSKHGAEFWNYEAYENRVPNSLVKTIRVALDESIEEITEALADQYHVAPEDLYDGFFLQSISREVYRQKYALTDNDNVRIEEDVFESMIRVALAVAAVELRDFNDLSRFAEYFVKFFVMLALKQFSGGGRIMANAGATDYKTNTTLINCTVMEQIPDSIEGIMDVAKEAALSLKAGAGVGYNFSTIRPKGAYVHGAGAETSGVLSFMDIFDKTCSTIMSAGGRRGAQMATLHVEHPEIRDFVTAKREDGVLRYFNLSVLPSDHFMEAVENDEEIELWFWERSKHDGSSLSEGEVYTVNAGDIPYSRPDYNYFTFGKNHVEVKYGNAAEGEIFKKKVYETIRARELYDLIMQSTYDFAEPGFILVDRINEMNPLAPYGEHIQATNPCVTGDTLVPTSKGLVRIDSLVDEDEEFEVVVDTRPVADVRGTGIQTARAVYSGEKDVFEVVTDRGYKLLATADHKIFTDKGYKELQELEEGKRVAIQSGENGIRAAMPFEETDSVDGLVLGVFLRNGTIVTDTVEDSEGNEVQRKGYKFEFSAFEQVVSTYVHDRFMQLFVDEDSTPAFDVDHDEETKTNIITYHDPRIVEWFEERGYVYDIRVPESIINGNRRLLDGFLKGVFSTLGGLHLLDENVFPKKFQKRKGAFFRDEETARLIHLLLLDVGVISALDEENGYYLVSAEKVQTLEYYVIYDKIASIKAIGREAVYDLQVDMAHTFIANGFVVHNCGEQPLPNHGSCNLGSLILHSFVLNPFDGVVTPNHNFDWNAYRYVIDVANRFLDNVNDITNLPLEGLRYQAWYKRRHGLGVTGVADTLAALGLPYGSKIGGAFLDELFMELGARSLLQSFAIANEKGAAPIYMYEGNGRIKESKYLVSVINSLTTKEEYAAELRRLSAADAPMRYSHATSIAPTGTMSLTWGDNVANGIEPTFSHSYTRNIRTTGKLAKVQERVYSLAYLWFLNVTRQPHKDNLELPSYMLTTDDISVEGHISVQSHAQRWIDSSVSKTCNVPSDYDFEDFKQAYLTAWHNGLKGFTTFRFNPNFSVGVLTRDNDLKNTNYEFKYETETEGGTISVSGDTMVEYRGEVMSAGNLYEALKEKMLGKM